MLIPFGFMKKEEAGGGGPLGDVRPLNGWQSSNQTNLIEFGAISAGTNRYLIVIVNQEGTLSTAGVHNAYFGDQTMTELTDILATSGWNATQIFGLNEAGIAAATGTDITTEEPPRGGGDIPSLGATCFEGVNQTTPIRDSDTNAPINGVDNGSGNTTGSYPYVQNMTINTNDMIIGSYMSTSGANFSTWLGELTPIGSEFSENVADDPSRGGYKSYSGSNTTIGELGMQGGSSQRCVGGFVILSHD